MSCSQFLKDGSQCSNPIAGWKKLSTKELDQGYPHIEGHVGSDHYCTKHMIWEYNWPLCERLDREDVPCGGRVYPDTHGKEKNLCLRCIQDMRKGCIIKRPEEEFPELGKEPSSSSSSSSSSSKSSWSVKIAPKVSAAAKVPDTKKDIFDYIYSDPDMKDEMEKVTQMEKEAKAEREKLEQKAKELVDLRKKITDFANKAVGKQLKAVAEFIETLQ